MTGYTIVPSPVGNLTLTSEGAGLSGLYLDEVDVGSWTADEGPLRPAVEQLERYWAGELRTFDLALSLHGSSFQQKVWRALADIPYGDTISYGELAVRVGSPRAVRAVGTANGRNPIPIVLPCHRVIGSDGRLAGYGGGLERKLRLLALEGVQFGPADAPLQRRRRFVTVP